MCIRMVIFLQGQKRKDKKVFKWKVKHYYLISTVGFLLVFVYSVLAHTVDGFDLLYLVCFSILNWISFRVLYRYRNMEVVRFAEVVKK